VRVAPRGNTLTLIARIRLSAKASPLYSCLCNVIETRLVFYAPCMLRRRPVLLYRETAMRVAPCGNTLTLIVRIRLSAKASPLYSRLCNVIETRLVLDAPLYFKKLVTFWFKLDECFQNHEIAH
jgi:hypothetical protein